MNRIPPPIGNQALSDKKERNSNLELYRIIVMLAIVAHHYVVNSGLPQVMESEPLTLKTAFFYLFGMWGKTGINCFVLITGYFMCKSNITLHKFLKLLLQVYFYTVVVNAVFAAAGYHQFGIKESIRLLWPLKGINSNFTSCYLMFFLCIPFLNVLIHNISKRQHQLLVALLLFGFSMVAFPKLHYDVRINYVTWFSVLYFIGSYLRLYPSRHDGDTRFWAVMTLVSVAMGMASVTYLLYRGLHTPYCYISDSNQLLSLAIGVSSFMLFKNLKVPQSKWINAIASTTFGVLLIHANSDIMRRWLWKDTVDCVGHYADTHYIIYSVAAVLCVFSFCSVIDYARIKLVEERMVGTVERCVNKCMKTLSDRYNKEVYKQRR